MCEATHAISGVLPIGVSSFLRTPKPPGLATPRNRANSTVVGKS